MIKTIIKSLELPQNEVLFLHVRLKGISDLPYNESAKQILKYLEEFYKPKTILVPTFTYSFTKTGIYNRKNTCSEVGRFGEEVRALYDYSYRTMNPVFNVVDIKKHFKLNNFDNATAFGENSMLDFLDDFGYIIINLNLPELINTHLHYLEYLEKVDYRFQKIFPGKVSSDGINFETIKYKYYVRKLDIDTRWRRAKIKDFLNKENVLNNHDYQNIVCNWLDTRLLTDVMRNKLQKDKYFLIKD